MLNIFTLSNYLTHPRTSPSLPLSSFPLSPVSFLSPCSLMTAIPPLLSSLLTSFILAMQLQNPHQLHQFLSLPTLSSLLSPSSIPSPQKHPLRVLRTDLQTCRLWKSPPRTNRHPFQEHTTRPVSFCRPHTNGDKIRASSIRSFSFVNSFNNQFL